MDSSVISLFQYTRSKVTPQDIIDFSPNDPGYDNYVKLWNEILRTGKIPQETEFDLSEVIGLTGWGDPEEEANPERFRIYRRFTSAVGVGLLNQGNDSESVRPANYLARDLLIDIEPDNRKYLNLLIEVFRNTRSQLMSTGFEEEYPFFTFGLMILHQLDDDYSSSDEVASLLIEDEAQVRNDESLKYLIDNEQFLLGLTNYDQLHDDWRKFASHLENPNKRENTQLVIDSIIE